MQKETASRRIIFRKTNNLACKLHENERKHKFWRNLLRQVEVFGMIKLIVYNPGRRKKLTEMWSKLEEAGDNKDEAYFIVYNIYIYLSFNCILKYNRNI